MVEADLERAEECAETGKSKIVELEEEFGVVGIFKSVKRRSKEAEARVELPTLCPVAAEGVDRLEDDLLSSKEKNKTMKVNDTASKM